MILGYSNDLATNNNGCGVIRLAIRQVFQGGSNPIDLNDEIYKSLKPLFEKVSDNAWTSIALENIRNVAKRQKYSIQNPTLEKTLNGYDVLIVIPSASAAETVR